MSIQSGINQILSSAGVMSSLGRQAYTQSNRYQGKQYQQQFEGSKRSLYDIYQNLKKPMDEKSYSETELNDIAARHRALNKSVYDVKIAELDPRYKGIIDTSGLKQKQLSVLNKEMEAAIADRRAALKATSTPQEPLGELPVHEPEDTTQKLLPAMEERRQLPAGRQIPLLPAGQQQKALTASQQQLALPSGDRKLLAQQIATQNAIDSLAKNGKNKLDKEMIKESYDLDRSDALDRIFGDDDSSVLDSIFENDFDTEINTEEELARLSLERARREQEDSLLRYKTLMDILDGYKKGSKDFYSFIMDSADDLFEKYKTSTSNLIDELEKEDEIRKKKQLKEDKDGTEK